MYQLAWNDDVPSEPRRNFDQALAVSLVVGKHRPHRALRSLQPKDINRPRTISEPVKANRSLQLRWEELL